MCVFITAGVAQGLQEWYEEAEDRTGTSILYNGETWHAQRRVDVQQSYMRGEHARSA